MTDKEKEIFKKVFMAAFDVGLEYCDAYDCELPPSVECDRDKEWNLFLNKWEKEND